VKALRRFEWLAHFGEHKAPPRCGGHLTASGSNRIRPMAERAGGKAGHTLVLCGEVEARPFERRAKWAMRRLEKSGLCAEVLPSIDHTLFAPVAGSAIALLSEYFLATYLPAPSSAGHHVCPRTPSWWRREPGARRHGRRRPDRV